MDSGCTVHLEDGETEDALDWSAYQRERLDAESTSFDNIRYAVEQIDADGDLIEVRLKRLATHPSGNPVDDGRIQRSIVFQRLRFTTEGQKITEIRVTTDVSVDIYSPDEQSVNV